MKVYWKNISVVLLYHFVDTDGVFISPDNVIISDSENTEYTLTTIMTNNPDSIAKRNERKSLILKMLCSTSQIATIPYDIFYLSRNLEHVLHNRADNVSDNEKRILSEDFDDKYANDLPGFLFFIKNTTFAVAGSYKQTWDFIQKDNNSLNRFSNVHILFS